MGRALLILITIFLLSFPAAAAAQNSIKLLAVAENDEGFKGATADLTVEIQPGSGRVFLDTFPLSKLDTQISTRFAKEIACEYSSSDCSRLDFFYTIRSTSAIIAGPSAGGALAAITLATLDNLPVDSGVAVTGTINSGGLIGPVSGIKQKLEAAQEAGITTVLIPAGDVSAFSDNESVNLTEYGASLGIEVVEVIDLDSVVARITGREAPERNTDFEVDAQYTTTMRELAAELCTRSRDLGSFNASSPLLNNARNLSLRGINAFADGQYYAGASFCFGANVRYGQARLDQENLTAREVNAAIRVGLRQVDERRASLPEYDTIRDLEAFALVTERLDEANRNFIEAQELVRDDNVPSAVRSLAFAQERIQSADSWSKFFGSGGRKVTISTEQLRNSCAIKLAEAEERIQYVNLFFDDILTETRRELNSAYADNREEKYDSCLFKASRAKAEADSVLGVIGATPAQVGRILDQKENAARIAIARQANEGSFPIAGYSYFEYAESLREFDPSSALLFYEYALELSDLDIYFDAPTHRERFDFTRLFVFARDVLLIASGIVIGSVGVVLLRRNAKKKIYVRKRKKRR